MTRLKMRYTLGLLPGLETLAHFPHRDGNPGAIKESAKTPAKRCIGYCGYINQKCRIDIVFYHLPQKNCDII